MIDLPGFELTGKAWQKVRQPLNRGEREGLTTLWSTWHDLPSRYSREITAVSEEWVAHKKLPEMGFTLGGMEELKDSDVGIFLALGKDGGIERPRAGCRVGPTGRSPAGRSTSCGAATDPCPASWSTSSPRRHCA